MAVSAPTLDVPAELGDKQWTLAPAFWFIAGETRNRFDDESDEQYVARVLKNKRIRDRARERQQRQRAEWLARNDAAEAAERIRRLAEVPAVPEPAQPQNNRVADLEQECARLALESRNWQLRCERMEARLMRVTTAMADLARLTATAATEVAEENERAEA
jgi:hypothetical protein